MSELPRPIGITSVVDEWEVKINMFGRPATKKVTALVTQILYEDGSIKRQMGEKEKWEVAKKPDGEIVPIIEIRIFEPNKECEIPLVCIHCDVPLHMDDDEWLYSVGSQTAWHRFKDDCDGAHQPDWINLQSKDDVDGRCENCNLIIMHGEDANRDEEGVIWHLKGSTRCRK